MNYHMRGTILVIAFIVFYKFFWGRRRNSDDSNDSTSQRSSSSTTVETLSGDSSSVSLLTGVYDVFLSFRGPDTRHNITDIIYRFLSKLKIRTFKDDDELRKGEGIWPNLVQAIGQSKVYVLIISEHYADSKWCLKELVEIVQQHKQDKGHIILPIFYMVDPRDVRNQTGPYQSAFQQHKKRNLDEKMIQSWKDALNEVGSLTGWHIKCKEEEVDKADLVSGVVWSHINKTINTIATDELVGIDDHVEQVIKMLNLDSQGVKVVGLYGIGGIGKTTLATAVYNKICTCFDRSSFVENIRETQQQSDGLLILQRKLMSNILRRDSVGSIIDINEGKKIIRDSISQFKVLVVLDDVDEKFKSEEILGDLSKFVSGSRFIITSRNIKILRSLTKDPHSLYEVHGMDEDRSLRLFCKHAFKKDFPLPGFEALSKSIVSTTGGLPLSLKVVGSLLFLEEEAVWEDKLEQLRKMPEEEVMSRLMISYNGLGYEAQQIFLDIACFYIETNKEFPSYMWSDCNFHPITNINLLVQRSMVKIGDANKFEMHDQLRDMGREIVRQECIEYPWKRSRIWSNDVAFELLLNNKGTEHVKAMRISTKSDFRSDCFMNLSELRYLNANMGNLKGDFTNLLPNLKWIQLNVKYKILIANFNMKNLIIFEASGVRGYWEDCDQFKEANKLKVLRLSSYHTIASKFPELPESGILEVLDIWGIYQELDMEIVKLQNLKVLRLHKCKLRTFKGGSIGTTMKRLRELDLSNTKCDYDNFKQVIADIKELSSLEILKIESYYLVDVLDGIKLPRSLKLLNTSSDFANLEELLELEEFTIRGSSNTIELVIPSTVNPWINLSKLKLMELQSMKSIVMVDSKNTMLPSSLTSLCIKTLLSEQIPSLKNLSNLEKLELRDCANLREIQGLGGLKSLQNLEIREAPELTHVDGLENLEELDSLKLYNLPKVERLPSLSKLRKLKRLELGNLPGLREIVGLGDGLKSLEWLTVFKCFSLERLPIRDLPLSNMRSMSLDLRGCTNFIDIESDLSTLTSTQRGNLGELRPFIYWPNGRFTSL